MIFLKKTPREAHELLNQVVYVWLGKMRWLPHIGPCYLVVSSRDDYVVAVPVNKERLPIGERKWIHVNDLACACDPFEEYPAVEEVLAQYRSARNATDDHFAKKLRSMETPSPEVSKLAKIRRRKRPKHNFYVPRNHKV